MPDFDALTDEVKQKAKIMYLNYPNNPTSAVATVPFFEEAVSFAKENDIFILHDMAYGGIGFDGEKPVSFLQAKGAKEIGIEMYTLSKTYNMAGWRVAFAVGNRDMIEAITKLQHYLFISLFPAVQHAAIAALSEDQACVHDLTALYEGRRNVLISECKRIGWDVEAPESVLLRLAARSARLYKRGICRHSPATSRRGRRAGPRLRSSMGKVMYGSVCLRAKSVLRKLFVELRS